MAGKHAGIALTGNTATAEWIDTCMTMTAGMPGDRLDRAHAEGVNAALAGKAEEDNPFGTNFSMPEWSAWGKGFRSYDDAIASSAEHGSVQFSIQANIVKP